MLGLVNFIHSMCSDNVYLNFIFFITPFDQIHTHIFINIHLPLIYVIAAISTQVLIGRG